MDELIELLSDGLKFIQRLKKLNPQLEHYSTVVNDLDKATQDILHKLELDDKISQKEKAKQATLIRNIRRDRRYYKDRAEAYSEIVNLLNSCMEPGTDFKHGFNKLETEMGKFRKKFSTREPRVYKPKFIKDLVINKNEESQGG